MRGRAVVLAAAIVMAPLGAWGADLVVWWERGFYPEEDSAVAEVVAAFEQESGKQVELTHYSNSELPDKLEAALEAGHPPDFAFGLTYVSSKWAFEDRLVDLTDTVGAFSNLFDPEALAWWFQLNGTTRQRALYALPMGRSTIHLHVWKSLMEQAGFTPADIPKEWDAFWSFWCDEVQPAVRQALGRDDIYGIGLNMSGKAPRSIFTSSSSWMPTMQNT
jgi:multiple sugar transport system substrate-binding protein